MLARIAEDEAKHAELAWQFVAWALLRGGEEIADVLSSALQRVTADLITTACRASEAASDSAARDAGARRRLEPAAP